MIKAGIIGGGGYTAGELIRILQYHPEVSLVSVQSKSQAGKAVSEVHEDLVGESDLAFSEEIDPGIDVLFLCMGHGQSKAFMEENEVPEEVTVIDLSQDFRLHPAWIYGLPEMNAASLHNATRIANPGCFATAIQLALLPLAKEGLLWEDVHVHAVTGSTGAGQFLQSTTHFSWRSNNLSVYKAFRHQHLAEISRSIARMHPEFEGEINFLPLRGDFARGIFATLYTTLPGSEGRFFELYKDYYRNAPFLVVTPKNPNLKQVINTNKCLLYLEKHEDKLLIISAIDNLTKGASGQAVQNMNLAFGLEETAGLRLKAIAF